MESEFEFFFPFLSFDLLCFALGPGLAYIVAFFFSFSFLLGRRLAKGGFNFLFLLLQSAIVIPTKKPRENCSVQSFFFFFFNGGEGTWLFRLFFPFFFFLYIKLF